MPFNNQVIWITGASGGLGEALAHAFADRGARLILSARRVGELERVASACAGRAPAVEVLPLDLADPAELADKAAAAQAAFGRIDVLVHAAGLSQRSAAVETADRVERLIMEVNYFAAVSLTKAVLPAMIRYGAGRIVVVGSLAGYIALPRRGTYAASKHALLGYFNALRVELAGSGVKVTVACPGYLRTDLSRHALTADGAPHATLDRTQARGMDPRRCAERIVQAAEYDKTEVLIGGAEVAAVYVRRWFPSLFDRLLARYRRP